MKIKFISIILAWIILNPSAYSQPKPLTLAGGETIHYQCDNGGKVSAQYYRLSDDSLSFVKLIYKDKDYTLPNVVSGSGARYTTLQDVEWWTKGNEATLTEEVYNEKSKPIACKEVSASNNKG